MDKFKNSHPTDIINRELSRPMSQNEIYRQSEAHNLQEEWHPPLKNILEIFNTVRKIPILKVSSDTCIAAGRPLL